MPRLPSNELLANESVETLLGRAIFGELAPTLDLTRCADKRRCLVNARLAHRHHVLRDELAKLRVARQHAGELEDVHVVTSSVTSQVRGAPLIGRR